MSRIFLTVGTTPFDDLIRVCDKELSTAHKVVMQISPYATYKPINFPYFEYGSDIDSYIEDAEIIISHAGAGSVYSILEKRKRAIFVPNFRMKDDHQEDICRYVAQNGYAAVYRVQYGISLADVLDSVLKTEFSVYERQSSELIGYLRGKLLK